MTKKLSLSLMLIMCLLVSACNFPLLSQPTEEPNALATAVAQTLQAMASQPLPTQQPPAQQPTMPAGLPTVTPPQPTAVFTVQAPPTATPQPCNKAQFLTETIPDDTEFNAGEAVTKSWTFKNAGTCTWNTNYKLVFASGEAMGGPASVKFSKSVAPNDQITIQVSLKAPATTGTYSATWKLQAEDGTQFDQVTVRIKVKSQAFAVTSVFTNLSNVSPEHCPYTYPMDISIETSAAGKVVYQTDSNGVVSGLQSLIFDAAGTKVVEMDWSGLGVEGETTVYSLKVFIKLPNNQTFGPFKFTVICPE
ncbi:MAG: NBR1-Ig-like domain-containing protein [Pelolinea sp.]|nr:NBR1-Ig-like domain-containing protein [Pelolinea sp.]